MANYQSIWNEIFQSQEQSEKNNHGQKDQKPIGQCDAGYCDICGSSNEALNKGKAISIKEIAECFENPLPKP